MELLLNLYEELLKAAEDGQVRQHLTNFVQDVAALTEAAKQIVDQARQRSQQGQ